MAHHGTIYVLFFSSGYFEEAINSIGNRDQFRFCSNEKLLLLLLNFIFVLVIVWKKNNDLESISSIFDIKYFFENRNSI